MHRYRLDIRTTSKLLNPDFFSALLYKKKLASPTGLERYAGQHSTSIRLESPGGFELYAGPLSLPRAA
jgi:hypothetical protein